MNPFSVLFFVLSFAALVLGIHCFRISRGYRKDNLAAAKARLSHTKHLKNVPYGRKLFPKWYKDWTEFTYAYQVDGKDYSLSGSTSGRPGQMPLNADVLYQKNAPRYGYIPEYTMPPMSGLHPFLFLCAGLLLFAGLQIAEF